MNGLETLDKIRACNHQLPVIILSSQDKIEVAVNCMHHHANDYVVKSETSFMRIQTIIASIIKFRKAEKELKWYMERM
jgi:DNA-binding NtrC family response regulator